MWFIIDALYAIEWSTVWDVTLGALLAMWVTHTSPQPAADGRQVVIPMDSSGGCHTTLQVNDHEFRVLLDSGSTGPALVFGSNMAAALGIDRKSLDFSHGYSSANGDGREAEAVIPELTLFGGTARNVPVAITEAAMDEGLLGSEFLHWAHFQTADGHCTLTLPPPE